jgi:hypothetical protein
MQAATCHFLPVAIVGSHSYLSSQFITTWLVLTACMRPVHPHASEEAEVEGLYDRSQVRLDNVVLDDERVIIRMINLLSKTAKHFL